MDILEPKVQNEPHIQIDLFLVPGLAFSIRGDRLGRGQGFYDHTLSRPEFRSIPKYGMAYENQVFEALPVGRTRCPHGFGVYAQKNCLCLSKPSGFCDALDQTETSE